MHKKNMRPDSIEGDLVDLELNGDNLQVWKNMLSEKPMFDGIKSTADILQKKLYANTKEPLLSV